MSEIVNYSVKIDVEQRDLLLKKIAESEMTAGNFLSAMLSNYEASQSRESLSDVRELNQLKNHLARIEEIYISLAKSRKDSEENNEQTTSDLKEQLKSMKARLVDVQASAKKEGEALRKELNDYKEEMGKEIEKYRSELSTAKEQKEIAEEGQRQAQKIATMTEQVLEQTNQQLAECKDKASLDSQRADQAISQLDIVTEQLFTTRQEVSMLKTQLELQKENAIRSLKDQQNNSEIEKQKAILAAGQLSLEKRESLQNEIVKLRDQLATERERFTQASLALATTNNAPKETHIED